MVIRTLDEGSKYFCRLSDQVTCYLVTCFHTTNDNPAAYRPVPRMGRVHWT